MTPFTLAGAMAPVTLAGALVEQNAEALAGIVLTQVVRPGAPVIYGGFTSNVDMQSGAPAFGTPEYMRTAMVGGQLARRYGVPYRSSNVSAANALDAQAAYESVFAIWGAVMGGVNLMMHGAGWMEGGLHAGFEKVILDAELLQMVAAFLDGVKVDDDELAIAAMEDVGPGWPLLRHPAHPVTLPDRVPQADALGLAQLRVVGGGGLAGGPVEGEPDLEGAPRRLHAAADGRAPAPRSCRRSSTAAKPRAASRPTIDGQTGLRLV